MRDVALISMVLYFQGMGGLLRRNLLLDFSVDGMTIIIIIDTIFDNNNNFLLLFYCML